MFVALDRVLESTASTGTGAITLAGAVDGFIPFSSIGVGNFTWYCIEAVDDLGVPTGQWEVGTGVVGPGTISRDVVHASSNSGLLVNFSAGLKRVFGNVPAHQLKKLVDQSGVNTGDQDLSNYLTISAASGMFQPLDADLTSIAALVPAGNAGKVITVNAGGTGYTLSTVSAGGGGDALQSLPLSQFAPTTSAQLAGVITNETGSGALVFGTSPTITSPLGIVKGDVGLSNVDNTSDLAKPVSGPQQAALDTKQPLDAELTSISLLVPAGNAGKVITVNAGGTGFMLATVSGGGGGGDAMKADSLAQFAATTSAELAGVITDETGTGALVFGTGPTITNPVGITKANVGLGNVDNTSDANKPVSTAQQTAINAAITTHEAAVNPHPVYLTQPEGDSLYAAIGHTHAYQPLDADLTSIAGLTVTGNAGKVITVNAGGTGYTLATPSGGGGNPPVTEDSTTNAMMRPVFVSAIGNPPLKVTFNTFFINPSTGEFGAQSLTAGGQQGGPGAEGRVKLMHDSGGGSIDLRPPVFPGPAVGSWTFRFPANAGGVNQVLTTDGTGVSSWKNPNNIVSMVNYVYGYHLDWVDVSKVYVYSGQARDSTNSVSLEVSQFQMDTSVNGAINGNDSFQGAGTVTYTSTTGALVGVGSAFLTAFGTRPMSGNISSVGTSTSLAGDGNSKFLSEIRIGDLIGHPSKGFYRVANIQNDTSLVLASIPSPLFAGEAATCVENPTIEVVGNVVVRVNIIKDDVTATIDTGAGNRAGVNYFIGRIYATGNTHLMIYAIAGPSLSAYIFSTQRITPFAKGFGGSAGISGYNQYFRRIGSVLLNAGSIVAFSQYGMGHERWVYYDVPINTVNLRILAGGTSTAWAAVNASSAVPPSAAMIMVNTIASTSAVAVSLRKRNPESASGNRPNRLVNSGSGQLAVPMAVPIDWSGYIDYLVSAGNCTLDVIGYMESL